MRILRQISAGIDRLNGWMGLAIRWLVLLMVLVGAFNAIARYVTRYTGVGISATSLFETQWYLFSIIFLLGAAYGLERDVHVRVDVVYAQLTDRGRAWIDLLGTLIFLIPFSVMMLWVSYPAVRNSWRRLEVSMDPGGLPRYPIKALLLVSFVLLLLQAFSQLIKQIEILRGRGEPGGAVAQVSSTPDTHHGESL